jgi:endonuclease YncB( thermonuclease family)
MDRPHRLGEPIVLARRVLPTVLALSGVLIGGLAISAAGKRLADDYAATVAAEDLALDAETEDLALRAAEPESPDGPQRAVQPGQAGKTPDEARVTVAKAENPADYERIAPRAPLGDLGAAQPPKPKKPIPPEDWKATRLFNPVATSAGTIEAQGYRVALAGIEPTPIEEDCTYEGREWPCGAQARTAFRAWLRARAVQCVVPPTPDRELITAECNIGKEDLSAWLVESGWAKPSDESHFADIAEKARSAKRGVYGPPQNRVSLTIDPSRSAPLNAPAVEPATGALPEPPGGAPTANEVLPPVPAQP